MPVSDGDGTESSSLVERVTTEDLSLEVRDDLLFIAVGNVLDLLIKIGKGRY